MIVLSDGFSAGRHLDLGIAYQRQNLFHEAVFEYDNVLRYAPHFEKYAHWNKATSLLSLGEYEEGFKEHDWGWRLFDWRGFGPVGDDMSRLRLLPMWDGEDISDKNLLVYHELGFGDAIQTMRYLPELKHRAKQVTLVISPELVRLSQQFGVEVVTKVPDDLSGYAYRLPFFGVMMALRQTLNNIPNAPYIRAGIVPSKFYEYDAPRVGIVWSGRTQKAFSLDYFLSMFEHDDFDLYSLQLGQVTDEVHPLEAEDFLDTADVIFGMDHVVTIDSAVAHLAGAMGHPSIHLLLPYLMDWRWWNTEVWYPTIKTYRQENVGDWIKPFSRLNETLRHT